ncbi:MAG TPA: MBL fold metallo-hydrolase [Pseudonocardiaceae bacterium]|nr:MBL fold metallo-hydrolase [Pseudonocardiaceae bacterium]
MATNPHAEVAVLTTGSPIDAAEGAIAFCGVYLVESTGPDGSIHRIVVDTGHVGRRPHVLGALDERGLSPADIDQVVLTHAHWDHVQNVDLFPEAEIVVSTAELDSIAAPSARDLATPAWTRLIFHDYRVTTVAPGTEITPGVGVLDAAGHTPGSIAVTVATGPGETSVVTGDALPNAAVATSRTGGNIYWDVPAAQRTIARLADAADVVYPGHDRPFRLSGPDVEFLAPLAMNLVTGPADREATRLDPLDLAAINDMSPTGPNDRWTAAARALTR